MKSEETEILKWLMSHPLWEHEHFAHVPPDMESYFQKNEDGTCTLAHSDEWPLIDIRGGSFSEAVRVDFVFVNPETLEWDDNEELNTHFQVWVEGGGWYDQSAEENSWEPTGGWNKHNKWIGVHDYRLNCGGDTVPEALLKLAELVKTYYNDDGTSKEIENDD
jgi:hypothetical protein